MSHTEMEQNSEATDPARESKDLLNIGSNSVQNEDKAFSNTIQNDTDSNPNLENVQGSFFYDKSHSNKDSELCKKTCDKKVKKNHRRFKSQSKASSEKYLWPFSCTKNDTLFLEKINDSHCTSNNVPRKKTSNAQFNAIQTVEKYNLFKTIYRFQFEMPHGWNDEEVWLFVACCKEKIKDFGDSSVDRIELWDDIVKSAANRSKNPTLFSVNSCIELSEVISKYVNKNLSLYLDNENFMKFYSDVKGLLPYFQEDGMRDTPTNSQHTSGMHHSPDKADKKIEKTFTNTKHKIKNKLNNDSISFKVNVPLSSAVFHNEENSKSCKDFNICKQIKLSFNKRAKKKRSPRKPKMATDKALHVVNNLKNKAVRHDSCADVKGATRMNPKRNYKSICNYNPKIEHDEFVGDSKKMLLNTEITSKNSDDFQSTAYGIYNQSHDSTIRTCHKVSKPCGMAGKNTRNKAKATTSCEPVKKNPISDFSKNINQNETAVITVQIDNISTGNNHCTGIVSNQQEESLTSAKEVNSNNLENIPTHQRMPQVTMESANNLGAMPSAYNSEQLEALNFYSSSKGPQWFQQTIAEFREHEMWKHQKFMKMQNEINVIERRRMDLLKKYIAVGKKYGIHQPE